MIYYSEVNEIETSEETTEDDIQYIDATESDAIRLIVSQAELNEAVETLPKIYDLFSFWLCLWLVLALLPRIRKQFMRHTGEMGDKK